MTILQRLRVFLCYAKEDKPIVQKLYSQLTSEGWLDVWLDEEKLLPGQEWDIEIEKAVEQADVVVVCLSDKAVDKEGYVQKELRFVLNIAEEKPGETIFVVPLRLDDCIVPRRLRAWQWVDYFPMSNQQWAYEHLLTSLRLRATKLGISTYPSGPMIENSGWITNATDELDEDDIETETYIKLTGLGQCGSFVVYDVIAYLYDQEASCKKIKAVPNQWKRDVSKLTSRIRSRGATLRILFAKYFKGLKTPYIPRFFVIDSDRNNAVVDGLQGEDINKKLGPLQILVAALTVANRNNGCNLGQVGEHVFRTERNNKKSSLFNKLKFGGTAAINTLVFAGGGGSGSGGAPVLNEESRKDSLLINMMVLPPYRISDQRQKWNTGRCIMRLAAVHKQTALLLFSNLSESLNDQFNVNSYICELVVRLCKFGYPGNVPKVATNIDRKDVQTFFSGKPAFVGMSSLNRDEPSKEEIERMVDQAFASRKYQDADETSPSSPAGLSIELPDAGEIELFSKIKRVMITIGLKPEYKGEVNIVDIVKCKVAERLGTDLSGLDCRAYSYMTPNAVELTVFFRHNNYRSNFLLNHFLDSYLKWHNGEKTESQYLLQEVTEESDKGFLEEVRMALEQEAGYNNFSDWIRANFNYPIIDVK